MLRNKLIATLLSSAVSVSFAAPLAQNTYASEVDMDNITEIKIAEDGNWIKEGGLNSYEGETIESAEQGQEVETRLKADNYIEINDLTQEQYEVFIENEELNWWFEEYIKDEDDQYAEYYNGWYKIYVYEPSFADWWEDYEEKGTVSAYGTPAMEINSSSVVINYRSFWAKEREGKDLSEEMNDGIPSWHNVGYISITSPIDAEVKLFLKDERNYYTIYLRAGVTFRAKLKSGNYSIVEINGVEIDTVDSYITNGNTIDIGWEENPSLDDPVEISIEEAVEAYNIEPIDLTGMPDRSIDQNQNLSSEEEVTASEETEEAEEAQGIEETKETQEEKAEITEESVDVSENTSQVDKPNWFKRITIAVIIVVLCAVIGAYIYFDKRRRR